MKRIIAVVLMMLAISAQAKTFEEWKQIANDPVQLRQYANNYSETVPAWVRAKANKLVILSHYTPIPSRPLSPMFHRGSRAGGHSNKEWEHYTICGNNGPIMVAFPGTRRRH